MDPASRRLFRIAIVVSLGGFIFGFDASVISGVVGYVSQAWGLSVWQQGLVVSAPTLAGVLASLTVAPLSDVVGRRRMLITVACLYLVSAIASAFAPSFPTLVAARAIGGLAFGSLMVTPIYVAEIAPARLRGVMVSTNQINIVVGLSAAYFCNYLIVALSGRTEGWIVSLGIADSPWRWMLGLEILPAAIWIVLLFFVPESPRWLVVRGHSDQARRVLRDLLPAAEVESQIASVVDTLRESPKGSGTRLKELFGRKMWRVLGIGALVAVAQQITGINAVFFFATTIFEKCGVGRDAAFAQAVWIGLINVVFTVGAMLLVDRLGRRPLLIWGLAGAALSLGLVAYGFKQANYVLDADDLVTLAKSVGIDRLLPLQDQVFADDVSFREAAASVLGEDAFNANERVLIDAAIQMNAYVVLIGILGFVASFAASLGPVTWVVLSEIFPNHLRGLAMAAIGFLNAGTSFLVQFVFPWELTILGNAGTFLLYAIFGVLGLGLVMRYLPETKGRTLEEIEHQLQAG